MRVLCGWTDLQPETRAALDSSGYPVEYVDCRGDQSRYHGALEAAWRVGGDLAVVEHDIVPWPGALAELEACWRSWCAFPYELSVGYGSWLGCARFSASLLDAVPDAPAAVDRLRDDGTPRRYWARLDTRLAQVLEANGHRQHQHWPAVGHLNPAQRFLGAVNCSACGAPVPPEQMRLGPPPYACRSCGWTPRCAESVYRRGERLPCPNRARMIALGSPGAAWTPLCGTHENTDRWANYPDIDWRPVTA